MSKNLRLLATEMFKVKDNLSPSFIVDLFKKRDVTYDFRSHREFSRPRIKTIHWGMESIRYFGPIIWDMIPNEIQTSRSLELFKRAIKHWTPVDCPCRICKEYIGEIGFLWFYPKFCFMFICMIIITFITIHIMTHFILDFRFGINSPDKLWLICILYF